MIKDISKPALSALWPNKKGMSVVLDLGANIECNEKNLIDFSVMGSSLLKSLFPNETPKVALLNIGSEDYKGNDEGTANFITSELKKSFNDSFLGKLSALINIKNLKSFKAKLDPRLYNGAILLGLNSPVIKSHGSIDYIGFSYSLDVCYKIVKGNLIEKIKKNII